MHLNSHKITYMHLATGHSRSKQCQGNHFLGGVWPIFVCMYYVTGCLVIEVHDSLKNGLPDFLYHINQSSMSLIHMGHTVVGTYIF